MTIIHVLWYVSLFLSVFTHGEDTECFPLRQALKGLEFNIHSSTDKIKSLRDQTMQQEGHEKSLVDQLEVAQQDLVRTQNDTGRVRDSAKLLKKRLLAAEELAEELKYNYTVFATIKKESHDLLRQLQESAARLGSLRDLMSDRKRKTELKLNMLGTDLSASMKTLNDTEKTWRLRQMKEYELRSDAQMKIRKVAVISEQAALMESEEHVLSAQLRRLKGELTDKLAQLESLKHEKGSQINELVESQQRLDNARMEMKTLKHSYGLYVNGTLSNVLQRVKELDVQGAKLRTALDTVTDVLPIKAHISRISAASKSSDDSSDLTSDSLRQLVRGSRKFLSQHGYRDVGSLIEESNAYGGSDIDLFRKKSSELSNVRELTDISDTLLETVSSLSDALMRLHTIESNFDRLRNITAQESVKLKRLNASIAIVSPKIVQVELELNRDQTLYKNESIDDNNLLKIVSSIDHERADATEGSGHANHSLVDAVARTRNAFDEMNHQQGVVEDLKRTINSTKNILSDLATYIQGAGEVLDGSYTSIGSLQNYSNSIAVDAEDLQRKHMETIADVSELSRRMGEITEEMSRKEADQDSIKKDIDSLRRDIEESLVHRVMLLGELQDQVRVRDEFISRQNEIDGQMKQSLCVG